MNKLFSLLVLVALLVGCKGGDDSIDGPKEPFFYVEYYGNHWASVNFNQTCTMTITDENGQKVNYTLSNGSRNVIIGPVYAGFSATMTISAPQDGGTNGIIYISRNSDHSFMRYASFSNSKKAETLTYTIQETTGK